MTKEVMKFKTDRACEDYKKAKKKLATPAILGFIRKNNMYDKTVAEIDVIISDAIKLTGGKIIGEGDKFKMWCQQFNREVPDDELVALMNADPGNSMLEIKKRIPETPKLWKAYGSYRAGRGR